MIVFVLVGKAGEGAQGARRGEEVQLMVRMVQQLHSCSSYHGTYQYRNQ
jgi:hypothetical protein